MQPNRLFTQWECMTHKDPWKKASWTSWAIYGHCDSGVQKLKSCYDEHGVKTELAEVTWRGVSANKYCINNQKGSLTSQAECKLISSFNSKFRTMFVTSFSSACLLLISDSLFWMVAAIWTFGCINILARWATGGCAMSVIFEKQKGFGSRWWAGGCLNSAL